MTAFKLLAEDKPHRQAFTRHRPSGRCRVTDGNLLPIPGGQGLPQVSESPLSATGMRRQRLTGLIGEENVAFRATYGSRRVHAELTLGMGIKAMRGVLEF